MNRPNRSQSSFEGGGILDNIVFYAFNPIFSIPPHVRKVALQTPRSKNAHKATKKGVHDIDFCECDPFVIVTSNTHFNEKSCSNTLQYACNESMTRTQNPFIWINVEALTDANKNNTSHRQD